MVFEHTEVCKKHGRWTLGADEMYQGTYCPKCMEEDNAYGSRYQLKEMLRDIKRTIDYRKHKLTPKQRVTVLQYAAKALGIKKEESDGV